MCNLFTLSALVAGMQACAADSSDSEGESTTTEGVLLATIPLENGNTLDFHDMGSTALIAERGQAYTPPLYKASEGESLTAIWSRYARGQWLLDSFPICNPGVGQVFQFDKVSPWVNVQKVWSMQTFVCAASAVKYEVKIDGRATTFSLGTAQYSTST